MTFHGDLSASRVTRTFPLSFRSQNSETDLSLKNRVSLRTLRPRLRETCRPPRRRAAAHPHLQNKDIVRVISGLSFHNQEDQTSSNVPDLLTPLFPLRSLEFSHPFLLSVASRTVRTAGGGLVWCRGCASSDSPGVMKPHWKKPPDLLMGSDRSGGDEAGAYPSSSSFRI